VPEIEAKFLLQSPEQLDQVLAACQALGYTVGAGSTDLIVDRYFDTPEWDILRAGWAYRCRERGRTQTLSLKAVAAGERSGAVFTREEVEQPLPASRRPNGILPEGPVAARLTHMSSGGQRQELFRIRNRRTVFEVSAADEPHTTIELAFDRTQILATEDDASGMAFLELELELKSGSARTLRRLAASLQKDLDLLSAQLSKFERGLQAAGLELPATGPRKSRNLTRDDGILDLAYEHLTRQLAVLKLQEPRAWEGLNPKGVHQMRIAIRRIRAALRMLGDLLPGERVACFNNELRWLAKALGGVRDADVYDENFHHYLAALPEHDVLALVPYEHHLQQVRVKARVDLVEALNSARYESLITDFERFLAAGPAPGALRRFGDLTIGAAADTFVNKAIKKMLKRGRGIKKSSPPAALHRLRIEGKRVRYTLEYFSGFFEHGLKRTLNALRDLQNVLGEYQDACTACEKLAAYADTAPLTPESRRELLALGRLVQSQEQHGLQARGQFPKLWRRFEKSAD
jgi:CHAD domain-containing protein